MSGIMKRAEVCAVTGLCYTSIYNKMKAGDFPLSRKLGNISSRSVGWLRSEVDTWLNGLQAAYVQQGDSFVSVDRVAL